MKVDEMDKYQVTEKIKLLKKRITTDIHINNLDPEVYEEILNPPVDNEGYVHKYYLREETKELIEVILEKK